ncbi:hypothetical protein DMI84_03055 [Escherichia coli]|nr:hypothetical protein DMI84_03055 [Escherichia coli]
MLGGADNPNGELPSYITGADTPDDNGCESGNSQALGDSSVTPLSSLLLSGVRVLSLYRRQCF